MRGIFYFDKMMPYGLEVNCVRPEEIEFAKDLPVRAAVLNITEYPYHWYSAVEIVYVLQGQIEIVMGGEAHTLRESRRWAGWR